jgi:hypothetical protein
MKKFFLFILITFLSALAAKAQIDSIFVGENAKRLGFNYYNYSNPSTENIEVYVWGGIKNPGIFLVPVGTDIVRLVTLTGGALDDRMYQSFKLIRPKNRTGNIKTDSAFVFNYQDFFDSEKKGGFAKNNPELQAGDILIFPLKPEKDFWETAGRISSIIILPLLGITSIILQIINLSK